jgi:hypothetical protein
VISEIWYKYYGRVDQFNHVKVGAGKRGWEHMLKTQDHPLIFGLLSMIDANIYLALKYFKPEQWSDKPHKHMRETMTHFLLSHAPQTPSAQHQFSVAAWQSQTTS